MWILHIPSMNWFSSWEAYKHRIPKTLNTQCKTPGTGDVYK